MIELGAYSIGYEFTINLVHNGNIKHGDLHVADLTRNNIGFIWIYTPIVSNIEIHSIDRIYLCDGYILGLVFDVYMSIIIYFYCRFETLPYVCKYWLGNLHTDYYFFVTKIKLQNKKIIQIVELLKTDPPSGQAKVSVL